MVNETVLIFPLLLYHARLCHIRDVILIIISILLDATLVNLLYIYDVQL